MIPIGAQPKENPMGSEMWDEFIGRGKGKGIDLTGDVNAKLEMAPGLAAAREAVLNEDVGWVDSVKKGIAFGDFPIIHPIEQAKFKNWIDDSSDDALAAFQAIWTRDESSIPERIRAFGELFPKSVTRGTGTRATVASVLLMGLDVEQYPPFRITAFEKAYERTGYDKHPAHRNEAGLYDHALGFLDRLMEEAQTRGLLLRHRLDAQSLVWMTKDDEFPPVPPHLSTLAAKMHLTHDFLSEIETLLDEKKQVIFQGPPGTGKTYVAQALAEHLAGSKEWVTLVQLHPSYAYEDFVQGFRPVVDGQASFELKDGPLLHAAENARSEPNAKHFLVIDEINRGNPAKVFGELYFLLEYRDREMRLLYSDEPFSLPDNLYIIGTMNTADRSIALVDLALRRRFYFVEFHPDDEPVKGVLRRWLKAKAPTMEWLAGVVERANEKMQDDRHAAIGPSYFMKDGLDNDGVKRIWKHSVLPYIEELLFGSGDLGGFDLDTLRNEADVNGEADAENEGGGTQ